MLPHIGCTKQQGGKKLETIHMAREKRGDNGQTIAYHAEPFVLCGCPLRWRITPARSFVLCGLPLRRPPAGELAHRRQNGKIFVEIVAHPRFGSPFGQDRLIPI